MKLFRRSFWMKALSLVEVLVVILLISTSLLLAIRLFPAVFMLNKKTEDLMIAKNLTEELIQTLHGELNTGQKTASGANCVYHDNSNIQANNLVNPDKCFWQLVILTSDPNYATYNNCCDTLIDKDDNVSAGNTFNQDINPSRFEPSSGSDWVATRQFWNNWRNKIETQLPPRLSTSPERASATVTARYIYTDPGTNILKLPLTSDYSNNFTNFRNAIFVSGSPMMLSSKYMLEVTVSVYWKNRLQEGTYTRDLNAPNYRLSTVITPPLSGTLRQPTAAPTASGTP